MRAMRAQFPACENEFRRIFFGSGEDNSTNGATQNGISNTNRCGLWSIADGGGENFVFFSPTENRSEQLDGKCTSKEIKAKAQMKIKVYSFIFRLCNSTAGHFFSFFVGFFFYFSQFEIEAVSRFWELCKLRDISVSIYGCRWLMSANVVCLKRKIKRKTATISALLRCSFRRLTVFVFVFFSLRRRKIKRLFELLLHVSIVNEYVNERVPNTHSQTSYIVCNSIYGWTSENCLNANYSNISFTTVCIVACTSAILHIHLACAPK